MPRNRVGQLITFGIEIDEDQKYTSYTWVNLKVGDTVQKVASRRGSAHDARTIADLNGVRSVLQVLLHKPKAKTDMTRLRVPGTLRQPGSLNVNADDAPPRITKGYQKLEVVDRPGRVGLSHFVGFDPIGMDVPICFEGRIVGSGEQVEADIAALERMAGRGNFSGASVGSGPVIRVSTTNDAGRVVPLVPPNYQFSSSNPSAPLWRIGDIAWDDNPQRDAGGNRVRQKAVVSLEQYTHATFQIRSAAQRAKSKPKSKAKKPDAKR